MAMGSVEEFVAK